MSNKTIDWIVEYPLDDLRSPKYVANIKKYGDHSDTCIICGRRMTGSKKIRYVHLLTNGNIVSYGSDDITQSQGFFPVGSDCAKKLIIQFTF